MVMEEKVPDSQEEPQDGTPSEAMEEGKEKAVAVASIVGNEGVEVPTPKAVKSTSVSSTSSCSSATTFVRTIRHQRHSSFQRWRRQMQRAWRWGSSANKEQGFRTSVNLEIMANQKRQWYQNQIRCQSRDQKRHEPTSLFEHFFIVGLHSHANVEVIEDAFVKRKTWETEVAKSDFLDLRKLQNCARSSMLDPQILFKYPPGKKLSMGERDLPAFCFPGGVKARLIQRTPSMSDLNEAIYGQEHLARDDSSFIFCLKDSDNATLYGVCLHVQEIVQRAPGILGAFSPPTRSCKTSHFFSLCSTVLLYTNKSTIL